MVWHQLQSESQKMKTCLALVLCLCVLTKTFAMSTDYGGNEVNSSRNYSGDDKNAVDTQKSDFSELSHTRLKRQIISDSDCPKNYVRKFGICWSCVTHPAVCGLDYDDSY